MTTISLVFKYTKNMMAVSLTIILAASCAATTEVVENSTSAELAPMARPSLVLNQRVVEINKITDEELHYDITKINDDRTHLGLNGDGCSWKAMNDFVSPALSWEGCSDDPDWRNGENKNMKKTGELWPLEVGNEVTYTFDQHNARGEKKGTISRKCTVEDVVNIEVGNEKLDTFKVVCKREEGGWWKTNVSYFSPRKGQSVKFVQTRKNDGLTMHRELLRIEQL